MGSDTRKRYSWQRIVGVFSIGWFIVPAITEHSPLTICGLVLGIVIYALAILRGTP